MHQRNKYGQAEAGSVAADKDTSRSHTAVGSTSVSQAMRSSKSGNLNIFSRLRNNIGTSKLFIAEYILSFWALTAILGALTALAYGLVDYFISDSGASSYSYSSEISYISLISSLTVLIIAWPIYLATTARTQNYERQNKHILSARGRRIVLGLVVILLTLTLVCVLGTLVFGLLATLLGAALGIDSTNGLSWSTAEKTMILILLIAPTLIYYYNHGQKDLGKYTRTKNIVIYLLVLTGLIVVMQLFPLIGQRGAVADSLIESDLRSIEQSITDYSSEEGELPSNMSKLDLDADIIKRAEKHDYSYYKKSYNKYELCAVFNTDSRSQAYGYKYAKHREGKECYDNTVSSYYLNSRSNDYELEELDYYDY